MFFRIIRVRRVPFHERHKVMLNKRTKIVATISSLNCGEELIRSLYENGMDVARLNTAHMSIEEAETIVANIRSVSPDIAIMVDTKGPNIRVANLAAPLTLTTGQLTVVSTGELAPEEGIQVNYPRFCDEVKPGQNILIDDGSVALSIISRKSDRLICKVVCGGIVKDKKSVNVPDAVLHTPALTKKDRAFVDFAIANGLDFIAHSFVRDRDDVMALQSILDTSASPIKIIAKIENRQGVQNLDGILDVAYGVMVARGDLGIEIPIEEVPLIQKHIIYECMRRRKPVITATQMLQSMESAPRPTRAEVSDIANAVMDGTDAVMLSGETANGKYPVESISMMACILQETEKSPENLFIRADQLSSGDQVRDNIVRAAVEISRRMPVRGIVCNTESGNSCNMCSAYRGHTPIFGLTYHPAVARQLMLSYGVRPVIMDFVDDPAELLKASLTKLTATKMVDNTDFVVLLGQLSEGSQATDFCSIVRPADVMAAGHNPAVNCK